MLSGTPSGQGLEARIEPVSEVSLQISGWVCYALCLQRAIKDGTMLMERQEEIIIVMGDLNARVGDERVEDVVGPSGIGTVNERGSRLIEWGQANDFTITNIDIKTTLGDSGLGRAPEIEVETK
ncbi:craniofacial development protein 2-like [Plakobranchus ocellatus]|uniref:Craniofacial development protein 2-like n=1 Tax=Plakobranchus ocellatus TaxID=259542 RepID=A0AAV4AII5_9GAST|nr:craniofacial development protein 2-like [Plakobranchus ocellatus]